MTIRSKLALSISGLLLISMSLLGYGVLAVSDSFARRDEVQKTAVIEHTLQKAAQDTLLQKDALALVSYINFLKAQFPSLCYAKIRWQAPERVWNLNVGEPIDKPAMLKMAIKSSDPSESGRLVIIQVGIDRDVLDQDVARDRRRLGKIILLMSGLTLLVGIGFSYWFARSLTAPLNSLVTLASEISAGKLGGKLEWSSDDELGALVKVFNTMSQRLEDLDETKKNFVSSVTHELRSPLGAIVSFLHLIEEKLKQKLAGAEAVQYQEYLGRIQTNVLRLGGFINDLLDVAKIEKGKMECVLKPMLLQDVVTEVCQFFEAKAGEQGVRLVPELDGLPTVLGDAGRLRQVIVNLVSNGLKFTPRGGEIRIRGEQYREGANRWVEVTVSDTGRGIDVSDLERLFKAFSQGRNVAEGVVGTKGTGLGLYIAKSIVEQHGGKIDVKSAEGQGSHISFSLRVAAEPTL